MPGKSPVALVLVAAWGAGVAGCGTSFSYDGTDAAAAADAPTEEQRESAAEASTFDGAVDAAADASSDAGACPNLPVPSQVASSSAPLAVVNDPGSSFGIYDPSLFYPKGSPGGVMSYSTVAPNSVHTRVAVSTDNGASFVYVSEPNEVTPVTLMSTDPSVCEAGTSCMVSGVLWHEVSSIMADPTDTAAPYKLFVHTYVSADGGAMLRRDWGYIGMQTSTDLTTWSTETKLLGWSSSAMGISSTGATESLSSIPELAKCIAFTEPGALVTPLGIDLALSCAFEPSPGVVDISVVLLRSTDHAASFQYVSELVPASDYACLGGTVPEILGPDLFTVGSTEYVVVSPVGPVTNTDAGGYRACVTIPVADPAAGTIARASNGAPSVVSFVEANDGRFTGPCTFAEGATSIGQVVPMQYADVPLFRIVDTTIPEP